MLIAKSGLFGVTEVESKQTSFINPSFGQFHYTLRWGIKEARAYLATCFPCTLPYPEKVRSA